MWDADDLSFVATLSGHRGSVRALETCTHVFSGEASYHFIAAATAASVDSDPTAASAAIADCCL